MPNNSHSLLWKKSNNKFKMKNITDDVWYEIFLRLPLDSIFKSKSVSKVWLSTLSNPNFINHWCKLNYSSLPWALVSLINLKEDSCPDDMLRRRVFTIACLDSHSEFIENHQNGFSFSFLNPDFTNIHLLGSSNGLVLLCHEELSDQGIYCVSNPLTQKWVSLPPTPTKHNCSVDGIMCSDECFSESASNYKVIHIPKFEDAVKGFKVEVFSSDLGEWSIHHVSCPGDVTWKLGLTDNLITCKGVLYWFQKRNNKILAVSVNGNTNHGYKGRLINLPDRAMDGDIWHIHLLGESEGLICYAIINGRERSLSVWVLEGKNWSLLYKDDKFHDFLVELESVLLIGEIGNTGLIKKLEILGFSPADKNVVILGYEKYIWAYNTRTKGYEQLCHPSFMRGKVVNPCVSILIFALKPRPTALPPISWRDTSMLDV